MALARVIPANPGNRQRLIFVLMGKEFALFEAADELLRRRNEPGTDQGAVDLALGRNELERNALRARIAQLRAGDPFEFPSPTVLDRLEKALRALEEAIAASAALTRLIKATDDVIQTLPAASTRPA